MKIREKMNTSLNYLHSPFTVTMKSDVTARETYPSTFQFFAHTKNCSITDSLSWFNYTNLIQNASKDMLHIHPNSEEGIACLKLSVFEMNDQGPIIVQGIRAVQAPLKTTNQQLLDEIHAGFPPQPAICPVQSNGLSPPCAARSPDQRYLYHSSLITCQCDQYCSYFDDCCPDYAGPNNTIFPDFEIIECTSRQFPVDAFRQVGFYLVTSCLPKYRLTELEANCRYPRMDFENNAIYHVPLAIGERSYKNAFCALCNDKVIEGNHFWQLELLGPNSEDCFNLLKQVKENPQLDDLVRLTANKKCLRRVGGVAHPGLQFLEGPTRLGKMCLHAAVKQSFHRGPKPPSKQPALVILQNDHTEVLEAHCFCRQCDTQALARYVFTDMAMIARMITGFKNRYMLTYRDMRPKFIWMFVDPAWQNAKNSSKEDSGLPSEAPRSQMNHKKLAFFLIFNIGMVRFEKV